MVCDRKARLLLVSSQARPPSSMVSFQRATANLIDSTVSLLARTTVLPSAATSWPPHDQRKGYHQAGASPNVWPAVCPIGRPLAFSFVPSPRESPKLSHAHSLDLEQARQIPPQYTLRMVGPFVFRCQARQGLMTGGNYFRVGVVSQLEPFPLA